jgi:hypothetical protein
MTSCRAAALVVAVPLAGCSAGFELGPPRQAVVAPPGATVVQTPAGDVIEEPTAIETVITGLGQAQQVRTLTRALAR